MPPPIPRCSNWAYSSLNSPSRFSLPRYGSRVGLYIFLFEACSAFTRVAACTLALSPIRDTPIEGFSHFVTSMTAPIASGWSNMPGGSCTHWKVPPFHGARQRRKSGPTQFMVCAAIESHELPPSKNARPAAVFPSGREEPLARARWSSAKLRLLAQPSVNASKLPTMTIVGTPPGTSARARSTPLRARLLRRRRAAEARRWRPPETWP
jgi:hypothetical protein